MARRGRARHLVLLGAVAVLDARLAGRDAGAEALLSDQRAGHRLRHHLLLGRAHDDDGAALHEGSAVPRRLHPRLVRDASGAKMSKSKGNVIDPLGVIDDYGADALRFTLARHGARRAATSSSRPQDVESYRNFATKLWNAARFAEMNGCATRRGLRSESGEGNAQPLDRARDRAGRARDHGGDRGLQLQRGGRRGLSLRLEHLLRLVSGTGQAGAARPRRRGQERDAAPWSPGRAMKS